MAEFCFDCYKKYFDKNAAKENLIISNELDLCEGCGEYKTTVIKSKRVSFFKLMKFWVEKQK